MRLIHDAKYDVGVGAVFLCERSPKRSELCVGRATLTNDAAVPARL